MTVREARTLTVSIEHPPAAVYAYLRDLSRWPEWSFVSSIEPFGDRWLATGAAGPAIITMVPPNDLGVVDHVVETSTGVRVVVPIRVIGNGDGSEVVFTTFRLPGMTEDDFDSDVAAVMQDLTSLKLVLEQPPTGRPRVGGTRSARVGQADRPG